MTEINGKWSAFEDPALSTYHRCNDVQTSYSFQERISLLEKFVRQLEKKIYLQQEQITELRREKM